MRRFWRVFCRIAADDDVEEFSIIGVDVRNDGCDLDSGGMLEKSISPRNKPSGNVSEMTSELCTDSNVSVASLPEDFMSRPAPPGCSLRNGVTS